MLLWSGEVCCWQLWVIDHFSLPQTCLMLFYFLIVRQQTTIKIEANHHYPAWEIREVCSRSHRDSDAVLWHIWAPAVRLFVHLTIQTVWCGKLTRNEYKLENVSRFSRNAVRTQMSVSERCSFTDFFIKQHKAAVDCWILWNANYVSLCSLFV